MSKQSLNSINSALFTIKEQLRRPIDRGKEGIADTSSTLGENIGSLRQKIKDLESNLSKSSKRGNKWRGGEKQDSSIERCTKPEVNILKEESSDEDLLASSSTYFNHNRKGRNPLKAHVSFGELGSKEYLDMGENKQNSKYKKLEINDLGEESISNRRRGKSSNHGGEYGRYVKYKRKSINCSRDYPKYKSWREENNLSPRPIITVSPKTRENIYISGIQKSDEYSAKLFHEKEKKGYLMERIREIDRQIEDERKLAQEVRRIKEDYDILLITYKNSEDIRRKQKEMIDSLSHELHILNGGNNYKEIKKYKDQIKIDSFVNRKVRFKPGIHSLEGKYYVNKRKIK